MLSPEQVYYLPKSFMPDGPTPIPDWCPKNPHVYCTPNDEMNAMNFALQAGTRQYCFSDVPEDIKPLFKQNEDGNCVSLMWTTIPEEDWGQWTKVRDFFENQKITTATPVRTKTPTPAPSSTPEQNFNFVPTAQPNPTELPAKNPSTKTDETSIYGLAAVGAFISIVVGRKIILTTKSWIKDLFGPEKVVLTPESALRASEAEGEGIENKQGAVVEYTDDGGGTYKTGTPYKASRDPKDKTFKTKMPLTQEQKNEQGKNNRPKELRQQAERVAIDRTPKDPQFDYPTSLIPREEEMAKGPREINLGNVDSEIASMASLSTMEKVNLQIIKKRLQKEAGIVEMTIQDQEKLRSMEMEHSNALSSGSIATAANWARYIEEFKAKFTK